MSSTLRKLGFATNFPPECPSELDVDRLFNGELGGDHPVRAHVDGCLLCRDRMTEREAPLPPDLSARMLAEIHCGVVERARPRSWLERVLRSVAPLRHFAVIAAVAAVVFILTPREDRVRSKGGLGLVVYRERGGDVDKMLSGEQFAEGDRLRFEVELPEPGHLMIVGVEADGDTFPCYTGESERSVGRIETAKQVLPGAVELDGSEGKEQLHAILCQAPFSFDQVTVERGRVVSPSGCVSTPFILDKEPE